MLRRIISFIAALAVSIVSICVFALPAAASEYSDEVSDKLGSAVESALGDDAKKAIEQSGVTIDDEQGMGQVSAGYILGYIWNSISEQISAPLGLLGRLLGIILICTMFSSLSDGSGDLSYILGIVGTLSVVGVIYGHISSALGLICDMLGELNAFMLAYIPVFVSLLTSGGYVLSASGYYIVLIGICEVISLFAERLIVPLCSVVLAVSIAESLCPLYSSRISAMMKRFIQWALGISATVFVGVLSIKSIVAGAADTVSVRAAKFTVSSFIPVIGGAISDAYTTVSGSLALIRSAAGGFGIIAVTLTVIRPVAAVLTMSAAVRLASACAEILGQSSISRLLSGVGDVLSIILTIALLMSLIFIIATAIMMLICMNIA